MELMDLRDEQSERGRARSLEPVTGQMLGFSAIFMDIYGFYWILWYCTVDGIGDFWGLRFQPYSNVGAMW